MASSRDITVNEKVLVLAFHQRGIDGKRGGGIVRAMFSALAYEGVKTYPAACIRDCGVVPP